MLVFQSTKRGTKLLHHVPTATRC